ncbi:MAG TPA: helix-turn-helix domain-containing protein [Steroidobacter sp.]
MSAKPVGIGPIQTVPVTLESAGKATLRLHALSELHGSESVLELLFTEASSQNCGRQTMIDRLFEVVLIQLLRKLMERGQMKTGMLAGLAHPQLRRALVAMHEQPEKDWSLEELASVAGMSRSVFARSFRETIDDTPASYLQRWRIGLAQKVLLQERSLKLIAQDAGYGSEAALSRAFKMHVGQSPREWRKAQVAEAQAAGQIATTFAPDDLAEFLLSSWEGAILRMKVTRNAEPLERFKRVAFATVFKEP